MRTDAAFVLQCALLRCDFRTAPEAAELLFMADTVWANNYRFGDKFNVALRQAILDHCKPGCAVASTLEIFLQSRRCKKLLPKAGAFLLVFVSFL